MTRNYRNHICEECHHFDPPQRIQTPGMDPRQLLDDNGVCHQPPAVVGFMDPQTRQVHMMVQQRRIPADTPACCEFVQREDA